MLEALRGAGLTVKRGTGVVDATLDIELAVVSWQLAALRDFRQPLRAFLGSVGYYRKFIVGFVNLSAILTPATSSTAPRVVQWTQEMEAAFCELKCVLANHVILNIPQAEDQFILHTDSSGVGVGSVLNIIKNGVEVPVAFYSRQLRGAELRYSVTELESLAIVCRPLHPLLVWTSVHSSYRSQAMLCPPVQLSPESSPSRDGSQTPRDVSENCVPPRDRSC